MIIEDEPMARKILSKYIRQLKGFVIVCEAQTAEMGREYLSSNTIDLLFLDINLPGTDGVSFYRSLVNPPKVILTTAYQEFAVEGFEISAVDFLLKPFSYDRFIKAVNKFLIQEKQVGIHENTDVVFLKSNKRVYRIKYDSIQFIEGLGDYVCVQTDSRKIIIHEKMKDLEERLRDFGFDRIHKSFIVNNLHVEYVEGNQMNVNGKLLPIGKVYRQNILSLNDEH
ncbi:LytR/AlgR family response regulator transcription factor [Saccharicrinis sp. FJH62]|uniref:LytR/AlgR family response regulator transcription factor n=1 Tax=Saccharicrinis sp. FJH62 TaxID=3344657 RepID=UPI0035D4B87A